MNYKYNQAPKEFAAQSAKFLKKCPTIQDLPWDDYIMMPKYDGILAIIIGPERKAITRQGERILSIDHIVDAVCDVCPDDVVFGELWIPDTKHKDINGMARRHAPSPALMLVAFDIVPHQDWLAGYCIQPYRGRLSRVRHLACTSPSANFISAASLDLDDPEGYANALVNLQSSAYDGCVLWNLDAEWKVGASKDGEVIKVKPGCTFLDLRIVAQHAEVRATKLGGFITVEVNGVQSDVGSGLTQDMLKQILLHKADPSKGVNLVGNLAEVKCMGTTPAGRLREPRLKGIRWDKTRPDQLN